MEYQYLNSNEESNYLKRVMSLACIFMLLFSAFNAAQNMVSQIYSQLGYSALGNVTLITLYVVFSIANLFVTKFLQYFSYQIALFLSCLGYALFQLAGVIACACEVDGDLFFCSTGYIYAINVIGAFCCGFCAPILWVAQAGYTTDHCTEKTKSKFFGAFYAIHMFSQVIGNVATAVILSYLSHFVYFIILFFMSIAAAICFLFLPSPPKVSSQAVKTDVKESLVKIWETLREPSMTLMSYSCAWVGILMGFYSGFMYKIIQKCLGDGLTDSEVNQQTAYVFICLGCCEFVGGILCSKIGDKVNKYVLMTAATLICEGALFFSLLAVYENYMVWIFISAGLWGLGECISHSMINSILSTDLGNKMEGFAIYKLASSVGALFAYGLSIGLDGQSLYIYIIIITVMQVLCNMAISGIKPDPSKRDSLKSYSN